MAELARTIVRDSPRQREIVEALRKRILSGEFGSGNRVPSVSELAAAHNASTRTAQSALMHLQESGFVTSRPGAGSFVSDTPPHLSHFAMVFRQTPEPDGWWSQFFVAWKREAERFIAHDGEGGRRGFRLSFFCLDQRLVGTPAERELQSGLEADLFAGLIFPNFPNALLGTAILADRKTPKVSCVDELVDGFTVLLSDKSLPEKALRYLASRGRRRVAILVPSFYDRGTLPVDRLVRQAANCGLTTYRHWVQGIDIGSPEWAANWTEFLCRCGPERPDALLIMDDNLVPDATQGLLNAGVRVPDDIDVVAHCNFPYPTYSAVSAKRIGYDVRHLLHLSVETIERQRHGEAPPGFVSITSHFDDELPYPIEVEKF